MHYIITCKKKVRPFFQCVKAWFCAIARRKYGYTYLFSFPLLLPFLLGQTTGMEEKMPEYQTVQQTEYCLEAPVDWEILLEEEQTEELVFQDTQGNPLGGLNIRYLPENESFPQGIYDNHTEVLYQVTEQSYTKTLLRVTPPAASGENWYKNEIHYDFLFPYGGIVYDLYFDSEKVPESQSDVVASSFQLDDEMVMSNIWAEAWKERDGSMRYPMMSQEEKERYLAQQKLDDGTYARTIGWSSPWVVEYWVEKEQEDSTCIHYIGNTSDPGREYAWEEELEFGWENSERVVVKSAMTEIYGMNQ